MTIVTAQETKINLLPEDPFEGSWGGKFLKWAVSIGRYIVIVTELIVILAFLSRFKLDRDSTDLTEAIAQKQAVAEAYGEIEQNYRALANRLETIGSVEKDGLKPVERLVQLARLTPLEVTFSSIELGGADMKLSGRAGSEAGLRTFLNKLKQEKLFAGVSVSQITSNGEVGPGIEFKLTVRLTETGHAL